jgi:hypothetical protein
MDGDEKSNATMYPTTRRTTCGWPKEHLSDPDVVNPFRETANIRVAEARKKLLHRDGRHWTATRLLKREGVSLGYLCHISGILQNYELIITKLWVYYY